MCHNHQEHSCACHHTRKDNTLLKILFSLVILASAIILNMPERIKILLFILAYISAGSDVIITAVKNIFKGKVFDENFLMTIATLGAFAINEYPEAVMVMILYQAGEFLQHKAVEKSRKSVEKLMDIRPDYAYVKYNDKVLKKHPSDVTVGETIIVKAGEKIPLDGIVVSGEAYIDTSALTGESTPRKLLENNEALSGCINKNGYLEIKVSKKFSDSTVSKILELIENASSKKTKTENFITRFAKYYTPLVVLTAVLLAVVPPIMGFGQFSLWFERALILLVISCPCALVISVPLGFFAGIGGASRNGILIKGSGYLESLSKASAVIFDKTGTLTKGVFNVVKIVSKNSDVSEEQILKQAVKAEFYSNHPIALALKKACKEEINTQNSNAQKINEIAGMGIEAQIDGENILAGNDKLMQKNNIDFLDTKENGSIVHVAVDKKYLGYIVISDEIKKEAYCSINNLKKLAKNIYMFSGDSIKSAGYTARMLCIDKFFAQLTPAGKVEKIEKLFEQKKNNENIVFVGDGINDAPVLTRADVGIAMGGLGSDAAIEAADIVIMDDKLSKINLAIKISRKTLKIVKQNIVLALGVKGLFIFLGAIGYMSIWGAVFADVGVTLIAVLNSLRAMYIKKDNNIALESNV